MYKKTITYVDYDDNKRTEDHYFHLNKAELIKKLTPNGGVALDKELEQLFIEQNGKKIMAFFEDLIHLSYGRKSLDGRKFEKSEEIWNDFYQTEAYSVFFTELVTNAAAAIDFVNNILPKDLSEEVDKMLKEHPEEIPETLRGYIGSDKAVN